MSLIQVKVIYTYYTRKRTTPLFISEEELLSDNFKSFNYRILTEVPHLAKTCSSLQFTVLDGDLEVDLSPDYFALQMKELLNKGKNVTLRAFSFESPVGGVAVDSNQKMEKPLPRVEVRRALQLPLLDDDESEGDGHDTLEDPSESPEEIYLSPVDKLIMSKKQEIKTQKEKIAEKTEEINTLEEAFSVNPLDTSRPACSKCHLRAGHTRTNCKNKVCMSARICGDLKRHSEDKKEIKDLQSDLKHLNNMLKRQKDELSNLQETVKSSKRTFSQLIHSDLISSNKHKYISTANGREVINWMQLNTDSKKIEKMCGGKLPKPNVSLQKLIAQHDTQEQRIDTDAKANRTINKQVKHLWEKKGVVFPGSGPMYLDEEKPDTSLPSTSIPIPSTTEEEEYQTRLAIRESERVAANNDRMARQNHLPISVNPPQVMVHPYSSAYYQSHHIDHGQNNAGTPTVLPYFFNQHVHSMVPARFNVPIEPPNAQIYQNCNPNCNLNMPSVHDQALCGRELLCDMSNPHDVQHMVEQEKESISTTKSAEVRENPLDILANAITGM